MEIKLLHTSDLERLVASPDAHNSEDNTFRICTIVELIELAEKVKKQNNLPNRDQLLVLIQNVCNDTNNFIHYIISLDIGCLSGSLFEEEEDAFWAPGIEQGTTPRQRVRRLTIRFRDGCWWWDVGLYEVIESWPDVVR